MRQIVVFTVCSRFGLKKVEEDQGKIVVKKMVEWDLGRIIFTMQMFNFHLKMSRACAFYICPSIFIDGQCLFVFRRGHRAGKMSAPNHLQHNQIPDFIQFHFRISSLQRCKECALGAHKHTLPPGVFYAVSPAQYHVPADQNLTRHGLQAGNFHRPGDGGKAWPFNEMNG